MATLDVLAYNGSNLFEWASSAAEHIGKQYAGTNIHIMGYSFGCPLAFELYLALLRVDVAVTAMVLLDFMLPENRPEGILPADIEDKMTLVLASAVMDDAASTTPENIPALKENLLATMPGLAPRFAAASRWKELLHRSTLSNGSIACPVLIVCSSDTHPLFDGVISPSAIEASWARVCRNRPLLQLLTGVHHLSLISEPTLGIPVTHFICSIEGVSCSSEKMTLALQLSSSRAAAVDAVRDHYRQRQGFTERHSSQ